MTENCNNTESNAREVNTGARFEFGKNWSNFLSVLDDERVSSAAESLKAMLAVDTLAGKTFLDVGSGSGLFSLAARRLGAKVVSFDYDPLSVSCTGELKRRHFPDDNNWTVEEGSVLDCAYLNNLGTFDVVYSWGVLHHTGAMWDALANVAASVAEEGILFLSLYNDQGGASRRWLRVKKTYNALPRIFRGLFAFIVYLPLELRSFLVLLMLGKPDYYFSHIANYKKVGRGMSWWYDKVDWIGGYPFEVSKPEEVFDFYKIRGFTLIKLKTCRGALDCNEYVFRKIGGGRGNGV